MKSFLLCCLLAGPALRGPAARAQAPAGDGLRGDYYQGLDFDRLEGSRRDAQLDFDWQGQPPLRGMLGDYFTVRWTGWLVPPVTGRYLLRLTVDDAVRLWLDNKQLLNEWRGQPLGYYEAAVDLQAGHAYRLRLDYAQYSVTSRLQLAWERPRQPETLGTWRNLWNVATKLQAENRQREVVPTRYLFSQFPTPRRPPASAPPRPMDIVSLASVQVRPPAGPRARPRPASTTQPAAAGQPVPFPLAVAAPRVSSLPQPPTVSVVAPPARLRPADTLATQLASGQAVTLRALYFEQGQASLLVAVRASLDTLARVLARHPALRLEVQGHTDNQGDPVLNQQLSQRRAEVVCRYLRTRGIAASRLQPVGLGGTQPVADNTSLAERPRNRRVVLRPLP